MAWDLKLDKTGDWEFDAKRDLASAEAEELISQRVMTRLKIIRGEFIYDSTGTLGSNIREVLNMGVPRGGPALEMLIRQALEPMDDVIISQVIINTFGDGTELVTDPREILATIHYQISMGLDEDLATEISGNLTAQATIPI